MDPNQMDLFDYVDPSVPPEQAATPDPSGIGGLNGFFYEAATQLYVCFARGSVRHWEGTAEHFQKQWRDKIIKNRSI